MKRRKAGAGALIEKIRLTESSRILSAFLFDRLFPQPSWISPAFFRLSLERAGPTIS